MTVARSRLTGGVTSHKPPPARPACAKSGVVNAKLEVVGQANARGGMHKAGEARKAANKA